MIHFAIGVDFIFIFKKEIKDILSNIYDVVISVKELLIKPNKPVQICNYNENDELQVYRGYDIAISDKIIIHQPTLDEICLYGEKNYWNMVTTLTSVGADMKFQLFDAGFDYTEISDYKLFYSVLSNSFTQDKTSIILGNLDFSKFKLYINQETEDVIMYDEQNDIQIDEYTYTVIMKVLREMHGFKRNSQLPANESTKMILIEDAREEYMRNKDKEYHSQLKNMISSMINCEGFKYSHEEVWNMKINAFLDSVKRVSKIKNAGLILQSGYSGFGVNLKEIPNKTIDWLGELD